MSAWKSGRNGPYCVFCRLLSLFFFRAQRLPQWRTLCMACTFLFFPLLGVSKSWAARRCTSNLFQVTPLPTKKDLKCLYQDQEIWSTKTLILRVSFSGKFLLPCSGSPDFFSVCSLFLLASMTFADLQLLCDFFFPDVASRHLLIFSVCNLCYTPRRHVSAFGVLLSAILEIDEALSAEKMAKRC